jgi:F-type H+-transporting ATPase subunit a
MHQISLIPETVFRLFGLPITNTLLTSWLVVAVISIGAIIFNLKSKKRPGKIQTAAEWCLEIILDFMETITGSRSAAVRLLPFIATIFFFVLAANWIGILPGVGSIGLIEKHGNETALVPFFRSVYSDLNMTLALALIAVSASHWLGMLTVGLAPHLRKFINFKNPLNFGLGILELVSEGAKVISFSFRLFGNVFAGEVLLVIVTGLVPYLAPFPFLGMELFVGLIQALIFAVLTLVFISSFTKTENSH